MMTLRIPRKAKPALYIILALIPLFVGGSWFLSNQIIRFDVRTYEADRLDHQIHKLPAFKFTEPVDILMPVDGAQISLWYFKNPQPKNCGILLAHGHRASRYGMLKYGPVFWSRGCDLLLMDFRRHGKSSGEYFTWGALEKYDMQKALAWFSKKSDLPIGKIGVFAESMGAAITIQMAELTPGLAFIALDSPYRDLRTMLLKQGEEQYGPIVGLVEPLIATVAEARGNFSLANVSPQLAAGHLTMPVFLLHSQQDSLVPFDHSQVLFQKIPHNRKVLHLTDWGARHTHSVNKRPDEYLKRLNNFLRTYAPNYGEEDKNLSLKKLGILY